MPLAAETQAEIKAEVDELRKRRAAVIEEAEETHARMKELEEEHKALTARNKAAMKESAGLRLAINAMKLRVPEAFTDELKLTPEA